MKVTFPHMGNQYVGSKVLLEELGVEVVVPPFCSKSTLELGTKYSPETICLPLKLNIGNYLESIALGADTVVITGSCGPCRFGYYAILEKEIMKWIGKPVEFIQLDPPRGKYKEFFNRIFKLTGTRNPYRLLKAMLRGIELVSLMDALDQLAYYKRPRQVTPGEVDRYLTRLHQEIREVKGYRQVKELILNTRRKIEAIKEDPHREIIKIGIIGEIYTIIEPFVNLEIEKKLGEMGVEVEKSLKPSRWAKEHLLLNPLKLSMEREAMANATPYLKTLIGGHARETLGYGVKFAKEGYDGIIQVYPFGCMPEIVAQSILPTIEREYQIPYLCIIVDELTGEAGYNTRIEAFVDLLRRRKEEKSREVLSGS